MIELPSDGYLKIAEAAALFNIPASSLRDYVTAGRVQHTRIGRHVRFSPDDVEAIRAAGVQPVASSATSYSPTRAQSSPSASFRARTCTTT